MNILKTSRNFALAGTLLVTAAAVGLYAPYAEAAADNMRGWNIHVEDYPVSHGMEKFIKEVSEKTAEILESVGLIDKANLPAVLLPYADQRTLEIAITIAGGADVILLDEPTAGMSHSETDRAVELITQATEGKTLIIVEHDMGVVFNLADRISVLVYGEIIATGKPEDVRGDPKVREAYLGDEADDKTEGDAA